MWCWICMLFSLLLVNMQSITVSGETCQAKTLLASELHYLAQQCTEEMHARIASNFIELVSQHLGTIEGGDGNEKGVIESVQVECGERSITLRRRDIVDSEQSSKVPLTLKFAVKVPLPSNTSVIDLNQTTKKISSALGDSLNETDLTLNISGVVLEYDESNPPVVRVVGLFCDKGQILQGTNCVSCPPGYFLDMDSSGCQACAVDQYQHQETQTSCFPCPSGTSTLGQRASKRPEDCRDNTPPSFNNTCPGNMVFYTGNCSSYRTLQRWKEPMATDNSGHVSISYPAIRPPVNLSIGLYNVLYSAIDSSGNRANCTFVVKVARKSCPVLQPPVHGSIASFSCGPAFGSLASLTCDTGYQLAGSSLRSCKADGTWSGNETTCNIIKCPSIQAPTYGMVSPRTCQIPSGVNYKTECSFMCNVTNGYQLEGAPKVSCLESGSWSDDTTKTICRDIEAPIITCPLDMDNIPTQPGQSYAIVTWKLPVPSDNSNETLKFEGLRPPQKLNVGKANITYEVTDSSGQSRSCAFFIQVKDFEPPKIADCPDHIYKSSKEKWVKIFFPPVTVTDNVGVDLFTTSRPNGSEFTWGKHHVTYTASDIAGNNAKCNFQVVIGGTRQAKVLLATEVHYIADKYTEVMNSRTVSGFIAHYTQYLGKLEECNGNEDCSIENVKVECGERGITLGRRRIAFNEQTSNVPLTVKFAVKVPLPSNASLVNLNQTTQRLSSNVLTFLNEIDLNLNIGGVVLKYDASRPPVVRVGGLVCDEGQVLKGITCVNCARGSYYNKTGCQACAVDQYQDQEAQSFCLPCPSGTSTFGQLASKSSTDCHEKRKPASSNQIPVISGTVTGTLTFITLIIVVVVRKRYLRNKRMTSTPIAYAPVPDDTSTRIQIKDEGDRDSHTNYSNETPYHHLPTSSPKHITKQEGTFTSAGGELSAPLDSNVRIIVPKGAIPAGVNQPVFFGVFFEEAPLLQNILVASDETLISPVVECGPHDISLKKPVEIIVPHCLCLGEAKKEWIIVYRCGNFSGNIEGRLTWERVPNESKKNGQSSFWFKVEKDSIRIKTNTFSLWSIFACGGPRRKRATVFASKPDPRSDLIYLRFYVYSDNEDSKKRVELAEKERFPGSRKSREKPFRMYKDDRVITVNLTDLEEGWNFDKTDDTQIYKYEKARGSGFRSKDACDFAVKPEDGRDVNVFSCMVKFQQEDDNEEHSFYLNPGFTPLKRQSIRRSSAEGGRSDTTSSSSRDEFSVDWDDYITSLGTEPVTEYQIYQISSDVGCDWRYLLRSLLMKEKVIDNLSEDYKYDKIAEKCFQGLLKWKQSDPELATVKTLAIALRQLRCFDALQKLRNCDESNISDY